MARGKSTSRSSARSGKDGARARAAGEAGAGGVGGGLAGMQDRFVSAWGQMGSTWGISRTMAEVHALLYITGAPLCTDDVMARLEISRGNASMSLRALLDWGIVTRIHKRGDRKEYFQAESDPWMILQAVVRERMKREVHPVLAALAELQDAAGDEGGSEEHRRRVEGMVELLDVFAKLGDRFVGAPAEQLRMTASALSEGPTP